jgi:hypothetical protein
MFRAGPGDGGRSPRAVSERLDGKADGAQLLPAAVGHIGRPPGGQPLPVDPESLNQVERVELRADLVLQHAGQRTGRRVGVLVDRLAGADALVAVGDDERAHASMTDGAPSVPQEAPQAFAQAVVDADHL